MRLTNFLRDAFIRAAMADVPKINYEEKAQKLAREAVMAKFKEAFPMLDYDAACESGWFESGSLSLPYGINNIYMKATCGYGMLQADKKLWPKLEALAEQKKEQDSKISTLESRLRGVAYACTTRKQLEEALPEFTSYLPAEEAKAAKTLPAVANVLSDFVKAGWPKQNKGKIAAAQAAAA
jgi:hypothetical protein